MVLISEGINNVTVKENKIPEDDSKREDSILTKL